MTRATRRVAILAVLAVLIVLGLAASAAAESPSPGSSTILRLGWTNDPDSLNPFTAYESSGTELIHLNYDLLVGYDAKTLSPKPELAESWSHDADGKVWTFKLRQGVTWSDGEPFTADDVVWTYKFVMSDSSNYYAGYVTFFEEVEAVDDHTVRITTSKPKANMLNLWIPILPEHIWAKIPKKAATNTYQNKPPVVGTGPFQVVEWKKGDYVRLRRNDEYWRALPKVNEVICQTYDNADTMVQDVKKGSLAAAWNIPIAQFDSVGQTQGVKAIKYVTKGFEELGFNCSTEPTSKGHPVLADWKFRQALNWAIDRDKIIEIAYGGAANPGASLVQSNYFTDPDYHWEPPADQSYSYDPDKAKSALDDAGYKDVDGDGVRDHKGKPITLRLWARSESATSQRAGKLLAGWFKDVGLDIKLEIMDDGVMSDKMYASTDDGKPAPDYDMFLWSWGGDPDPDFILSVLLTSQIMSWSDTYYSNEEYDRLYLEQQVTMDPVERKAVIDRMQEIVYRESPYIILAYTLDLEAYNVAEWTGWVRSPANTGGVFYTADNIDSYIFVGPKTEAAASGGLSGGAIAGIVIAALVVIGGVVWLLMRRGRSSRRAVEEA